MQISEIKVCILRIEGTNCEQEVFNSFKQLNANPEFVHLKQLIGECQSSQKRSLEDYQILMLPGGFSAGDYIRAGAIFSARMKILRKELIKFVEEGKAVFGICNGFQILVELGLLPAFDCTMSEIPQAILGINDSSRFECRTTLLKNENNGKCVFTKKIKKGEIREIPSAHAEGKLMFPKEKEKEYLQRLIEEDRIVFRYVDEKGNYAGYPWNPNGSFFNIAGICNEIGNVFGMMPHPERVFYNFQHAEWTRNKRKEGDGKKIFESVLEYVKKKF